MIPYEQLAAALERRAAGDQAPAVQEDNSLAGAPEAPPAEYEIGDVLSDEDAGA